MPDYNNSIIYKLCCSDVSIDDIYVGSTTNFIRRKHLHKQSCTNEKNINYNIPVYKFIRENGGWENWQMVQICAIQCENKRQLETEERKYIENLGATLNIKIPTREKRCEHDRQRAQCKECHGSGICLHDRQRSKCKECHGGSICEHERQRTACKECHGGSICEHDRRRSTCKECRGGSICSHDKRRNQCLICHTVSICEHDQRKIYCTLCHGNGLCEHKKRTERCKICSGVECHICGKVFSKENIKIHMNRFDHLKK